MLVAHNVKSFVPVTVILFSKCDIEDAVLNVDGPSNQSSDDLLGRRVALTTMTCFLAACGCLQLLQLSPPWALGSLPGLLFGC